MAKANAIAGIILILFGSYYTYESFKLPFWTSVGPGAGALPLVCGCLFVIFSFVLTARNLKEIHSAAGGDSAFTRWRFAVIIFGLMFLAALLAKKLGLLIVIFLFSFAYMVIVERIRLVSALALSIGITAGFFVLFQQWLDVPLSMGDLEVWLTR